MSSIDLLLEAPDMRTLQVEMVRMCIAEAGYDLGSIQPLTEHDVGFHEGFIFFCAGAVVPTDVCWKARELVGIGEAKCLRCTSRDRNAHHVVLPCRATQRLVLDCGAAESTTSRDRSDGAGSVVGMADSRAERG